MIKFTVEIVDEKFKYEYWIGDSHRASESKICSDSLCVFTNILHMASKAYINEHEEWMEEVKAKAYIERHPELLKLNYPHSKKV